MLSRASNTGWGLKSQPTRPPLQIEQRKVDMFCMFIFVHLRVVVVPLRTISINSNRFGSERMPFQVNLQSFFIPELWLTTIEDWLQWNWNLMLWLLQIHLVVFCQRHFTIFIQILFKGENSSQIFDLIKLK